MNNSITSACPLYNCTTSWWPLSSISILCTLQNCSSLSLAVHSTITIYSKRGLLNSFSLIINFVYNNKIKTVNPKKNQSWTFIGRTDKEAETPILWPLGMKGWLIRRDPDAGKDWRVEEKVNDRGWDGWMASRTKWTWLWASSGSWWWTAKPGVLQSIWLQRVGHDWATELNWLNNKIINNKIYQIHWFGNITNFT